MIWRASASSSGRVDASLTSAVDLVLGFDVLGHEERLEREHVALGPDQAELLLAREDERSERRDARLAHRLGEQRIRPPLGLERRGHEVVGAVEVDRIDLLGGDETGDLDRARGLVTLDGLELGVLDGDVLALGDLEAPHDLVGRQLDIVQRAPAFLSDRRETGPMEHLELHVRLARGRRRRRGKPDGDADEPEADGSVPGCAHAPTNSRADRSVRLLDPQSCTARPRPGSPARLRGVISRRMLGKTSPLW